MVKKAVLLLLLVAVAHFFAAECEPGFEETAQVQIVDGKTRPIENATVQITYQVDQTTGKGYTTTAPKKSDANGYATFIFRNQEVLEERVDCTYTVIVTYDNQKVEKKFTVNAHGPTIQVQVDAYRLNIRAVDQHDNVLPGAEISARGIRKTVGNDGRATLVLGSGDANVTLKYGDGIVSRKLLISNDTDYKYQVGVYDLTLWVVDDKNTPLVVNASVGGSALQTNSSGGLAIQKLLTARPEIKTVYRGVEKAIDADLAVQGEYYIVYDLHAPKIKNIVAKGDPDGIVIDMNVVEEGVRASGLAPDGIRVRYSYGGVDYFAPVYVKAKDEYEASIGSIAKDTIVELFVEARDNEGNIRSMKGFFSVVFENVTAPDGGGDGGSGGALGFPVDPLHIIGAGLVIIIILLGANYIREKLAQP